MIKKIGILTSGGDAPGMNAVIRAVTKASNNRDIEVIGILDGFKGLMEERFIPLTRHSVGGILSRGGTILGSARYEPFKDPEVQQKAVEILKKEGIEALVVIGGDGSFHGAAALNNLGIRCIGIPGTIDNDIHGTDFTIGFATAVSTIVDSIDKIRDTASSHHRCSIVEVMGNHCGDLATYAGIATGCEILIIPELRYDEEEVIKKLHYFESIGKKNAIIIACEKILDVRKLAHRITEETTFDCRATILGHVQRGGSPVPRDRIIATQMGEKAVDLLAMGDSGVCIGIDNESLVAIPFNQSFRVEKDQINYFYSLFDKLI